MKFETIQNTPVQVDFLELLNDRGWELSGNLAIHQPCNSNTKLVLIAQALEVGIPYTVSFKIKAITGSLGVGLSTAQQTYTSAGVYTLNLTATNAQEKITFRGTGYIELETINIVKEESPMTSKSEHTITWGETNNKWVTFKSYRPEMGFSLFSDMFTIKNGQMWIHKPDTSTYNLFYGQGFTTSVEFPVSSPRVKTYQSIAIHSNRIVGTSVDGIKTQLGHVSDLMESDFIEEEGIFYANFLRDKLTDIINGDRLKGRYIVMELEAKGDKKLQIFKVVTKSQVSTPNE